MDTKQTKQYIAIMEAALEGEQIECRCRGSGKPWTIVNVIVWNFSELEYRIAVDQEKEAYRIYLEGFTTKNQSYSPISAETRRGMRAVIDAVKRGEIQ